MTPSTLALRALPWLAIAATVGGLAVIVTAPTETASFGWFAYAPLSDSTFLAGTDGIHLTGQRLVGTVATIVGVVVLAFWLGLSIGRKRGVGG